jgi:hypothetical protein
MEAIGAELWGDGKKLGKVRVHSLARGTGGLVCGIIEVPESVAAAKAMTVRLDDGTWTSVSLDARTEAIGPTAFRGERVLSAAQAVEEVLAALSAARRPVRIPYVPDGLRVHRRRILAVGRTMAWAWRVDRDEFLRQVESQFQRFTVPQRPYRSAMIAAVSLLGQIAAREFESRMRATKVPTEVAAQARALLVVEVFPDGV